jgi:SAM-dependent methyltransferase
MNHLSRALRAWAKAHLSPRWLVRLRCARQGRGIPRWGNLRRTRPFSDNFGFDRGTPIDRYYLHHFLHRHRAHITGRVLEIQNSDYTKRFGHDLLETHTIDVNPAFRPTYHCDLARIDGCVPDGHYDCFLLPNTLSVLHDIEPCLSNAARIVRPGGVILATAAALVPLTGDMPNYWHLSADGWRELTRRAWPDTAVHVEAHGNCLAAIAAMLGLAHEEIDPAELDIHDARFPVLVTVFGQRRA